MDRESGDDAEPINKSSGDSSLASTPCRIGTPLPPRKRRSPYKREDVDLCRAVVTWTKNQLNVVQPWKTFMDTGKLSVPKSTQELSHRVPANVEKYRSNYGLVFLVIFAGYVLSSPVLFLGVVGAAGVCWALNVHQDDESAAVFNTGVVLTKGQRVAFATAVVLPLLYVVDAWTAGVCSMAACVVVSLMHAIFHQGDVGQERQKELENIPEETVN